MTVEIGGEEGGNSQRHLGGAAFQLVPSHISVGGPSLRMSEGQSKYRTPPWCCLVTVRCGSAPRLGQPRPASRNCGTDVARGLSVH